MSNHWPCRDQGTCVQVTCTLAPTDMHESDESWPGQSLQICDRENDVGSDIWSLVATLCDTFVRRRHFESNK